MAKGITGQEPEAAKVYADIIGLPHHVSENRPHMSIHDRAAQFAPFAALTGYDEMVREEERLTERRRELTEEETERLNQKLTILADVLADGHHPEVTAEYFVPDERKDGGRYETVTGRLKKIDQAGRKLVFYPERGSGNGPEVGFGFLTELGGAPVDHIG